MIRHDNIHGIKSVHLVGKQVSALMIGIVCQNEAFGQAAIALLLIFNVTIHNEFEGLRGLASGSGAHVEDGVMRLDVAQDRRHHTHQLLPRYYARVFGFIHKFMNTLQSLILS